MVELIEYIMVFAISAGLAATSIALVAGALPGLNQVAASSVSDQVAGAARVSVAEGRNVTLLLPVKDSTVSCAGGTMSVSIDGSATNYAIGYPCSFEYSGLTGACDFTFSPQNEALRLEVTC